MSTFPPPQPPAERVALVVGGSSDIGIAIATRLASSGAAVAVHYHRQQTAAQTVVDRLTDEGLLAMVATADVTSRRELVVMLDRVTSALGPIDTLVYCAADARFSRFLQSEPEDWAPQLEVTLMGFLNCAQPLVRGMVGGGWGRVVAIAAEGGVVGEPALAVASAAKAGMVGFVRSLAREVAGAGVTVNAVSPGFIPTRAVPARHREPDGLRKISQLYPARRLATPEHVAAAVAYLCSPEADLVTGQVISVGGGYSTP